MYPRQMPEAVLSCVMKLTSAESQVAVKTEVKTDMYASIPNVVVDRIIELRCNVVGCCQAGG